MEDNSTEANAEAPKKTTRRTRKPKAAADAAPVTEPSADSSAAAPKKAPARRKPRATAEKPSVAPDAPAPASAPETPAQGAASDEPAPQPRKRAPRRTKTVAASESEAKPVVNESAPSAAPATATEPPVAPRKRAPRVSPAPEQGVVAPPVAPAPSAPSTPEPAPSAPSTPEATASASTEKPAEPVKRRRGRPRKNPLPDEMTKMTQEATHASSEVLPAPSTTLREADEKSRETPVRHPGDRGGAASEQAAPTPVEVTSTPAPSEQVPTQTGGTTHRRHTQRNQGSQPNQGSQSNQGTQSNQGSNGSNQGASQNAGQGGQGNQGNQGGGQRSFRNDQYQNRSRNNGQANNQNSRHRNRHNNTTNQLPTTPSLSREDVLAMKVAELREKAAELSVPFVGVRKAELAEAVYQAAAKAEGFRDVTGILDITNEGYGFVRTGNYMAGEDDAFVPQQMIKQVGLRRGDKVSGTVRPSRPNDKYPAISKITAVNDAAPEGLATRPRFRDLTPIYPNERLVMENGKDSITGRAIDLVAPIGKGQRGLIVSPPKAGKTTVLKKVCESIAANNPEVYLICLLVDERPEEVTDMERSIHGDVVASTFDMPAENHTAVSELVIERAKRLVETGRDVVVVLDSITRLARAYNLAQPASGRILSGGVDSAALYPPKRFLGAARNIEGGGSLTILASALVDTGSKMDEVIFEEFKGTGNMELKLDRDLADKRIFPAIDPVASGTRNEDLLLDSEIRPFVWGIRRVLANMNNIERAETALIKGLRQTQSNEEFLIRSAKKAQQSDYVDSL